MDEVRPAGTARVDETTRRLDAEPGPDGTAGETSSPSTVWMFVRMIVVLALVIACIYGLVYLLRRSSQKGQVSGPYIKKAASLTLAPGKSVHVITVGSQGFLVGVADSSVTLISEIRDQELIDAMNLDAEKVPQAKARDFASLLGSFLPGNGGRGSQMSDGSREDGSFRSAAQTEEFLRRQRDRLRGSGTSGLPDGEEAQ